MNEVPVPPMPNDPMRLDHSNTIASNRTYVNDLNPSEQLEFHDPFYNEEPAGFFNFKIDQWDLRIAVYSAPSWWTRFKFRLLGIVWEEAV